MGKEKDYVIKTENLSKVYKRFWQRRGVEALKNLNMAVPRGEIFGFLGPNGAGKTTTIRILLNLIMPTSGKAWILGEEIGSIEVKKKIGYLSENPTFYGHLNAREFLDFYGRTFALPREERKRKIEELIELVGLKGKEDIPLKGYSKGMTQRIGIAQALINDPELVFLDEPISGLDPVGRKEIRDLILKIKEQGKSVFFSSHILADVEQLCDSIGILKDGELITIGELDSLLKPKEVEFIVEEMTEECRKILAKVVDKMIDEKDKTSLLLYDIEKSNEVKEILKKYNVKIRNINKIRDSLEEFFMEQIQAK